MGFEFGMVVLLSFVIPSVSSCLFREYISRNIVDTVFWYNGSSSCDQKLKFWWNWFLFDKEINFWYDESGFSICNIITNWHSKEWICEVSIADKYTSRDWFLVIRNCFSRFLEFISSHHQFDSRYQKLNWSNVTYHEICAEQFLHFLSSQYSSRTACQTGKTWTWT